MLAAEGCNSAPPATTDPGLSVPRVLDTSPAGEGIAPTGASGAAATAPDAGWELADAALAEPDAAPIELDAQLADAQPEAAQAADALPADAQPSAADVGLTDAEGTPEAGTNDLACESEQWILAPGFLPALKVDYIADRQSATIPPYVISSAGTPCATAQHKEDCMAALDLGSQIGRHIATTAGDTVRLWPGFAALDVLGAIDTPAEAIWWMSLNGYFVPCSTTYTQTSDGIRLKGVGFPFCAMLVDAGAPLGDTFVVRQDGAITLPAEAGGGPVDCNAVITVP